MSRAYVRLDPAYYERKLEQGYPLGAIAALVGCFCMAESQTTRGRFRDRAVLKALLGKEGGKWVAFLVDRGDLTVEPSGRIYVDGWDEWQEGDWQVKERMQRVRGRKRNGSSVATVPPVTPETVSPPSLAGAGRGGDQAGQTGRYMHDATKAFRHVTGHDADDTEKKWLAELCRDLGREAVIAALYDDPTPQRGVLGRISKILRKGKAAA